QVLEVLGSVVLSDGNTYQYTGPWSNPTWVGAFPPDGNYTTGSGDISVAFTGGDGTPDTVLGYPATQPEGGGNVPYVAPVAAALFNPAVANSFTHSLPINVYDSLGNSHQLIQY